MPRPVPYKIEIVLPAIAEHACGHQIEFADPTLGPPVLMKNQQEMQQHILKTLFAAETKSFAGQDRRDFFYNPNTNTLVVINPAKDKKCHIYGGTTYRPELNEQHFKQLFDREKKQYSLNKTGFEQEPVLHQKNGIVALRPEIAKEFAKGYLQQQQNDPRLNKNNPGHLAPAGKVAAEPKNKLQNCDIKQPQNFTKEPAHRRARTR